MSEQITIDNIVEMTDKIFVDIAKQLYIKDKRVDPIFVLFYKEEQPKVIAIPPYLMDEKDMLSEILKRAVRAQKDKLLAAMFMCEAWTLEVKGDIPDKPPTSISGHPDRKEAIMLALETHDWIKTKRIMVADGKIEKEGEWEQMKEGMGRFLSYGLCKDFKETNFDELKEKKTQKFDNSYIR
jgi:hypothetical protein